MPRQVFVTGGSGFIGGAIIERLRPHFRLLAMARSEAAAEVVSARGAEAVKCSLADITPADLGQAELVIHCAAVVAEWAPPGDFYETNVRGTARLLEAARGAGVRQFLHMSTDSVLLTGKPLRGVDESSPLAIDSPFEYASTKATAERLVLAANLPGRFETMAIRPTLVWGPGDTTVLPEVKELAEQGKFLWIEGGDFRISTTHIENLVHGVELAIANWSGGEAFFVTDEEPQTIRRFLTQYLDTDGVVLSERSVPASVARSLALVVEGIWKKVRPAAKPPLTRFAVASLANDYWVASEKARRVLGYVPPVTVEAGLAELMRAGSKHLKTDQESLGP